MKRKTKKERQEELLHRLNVYADWMIAEGKYLKKELGEIREEMASYNHKRSS